MESPLITGFTAYQAADLAGVSYSRVRYLDKCGLVVPDRFGSSVNATMVYSWKDIFKIRMVEILNQYPGIKINLIKNILETLDAKVKPENCDELIFCTPDGDVQIKNNFIVVLPDNEVYLGDPNESKEEACESIRRTIQISKGLKHVPPLTLIIIPSVQEIKDEIFANLKKSKIISIAEFEAKTKIKVA